MALCVSMSIDFVSSYGQTGTGKTYTMEGERSQEDCSWEEVSNSSIETQITLTAKDNYSQCI